MALDDGDRTLTSRRQFVVQSTAVGLAACFGLHRPAFAEPLPEVTTIRLAHGPTYCLGPQYLAEELLYLEGFEKVEYVPLTGPSFSPLVADGRVDMTMDTVPELIPAIDAGLPIVTLAGVHAGCYELFGNGKVFRVRDLKGRRVAVGDLGVSDHVLKAANLCALEPERVARLLVDKGYVNRYDYALQAMRDIPYGRWRDYDPEDALRFYALRLHEAGMIKSSPQKIIARGTDWRFLNELKRELKG